MFMVMLMIGGNCSFFRAKPAHISGHLPTLKAQAAMDDLDETLDNALRRTEDP
jgi:hypothetical protein